MVDAATQFRKNGYNDEDAAQLALVASQKRDEYMATYIKNRVNCWKPKPNWHGNQQPRLYCNI